MAHSPSRIAASRFGCSSAPMSPTQSSTPCCHVDPSGPPVTINLALWESNYYRHGESLHHEGGRLQLRQVYLRYQGTPHRNSTFEIDDSAMEGITYSATSPAGLITGNTVTLKITNPLCVKVYSRSQQYQFAVGFGQCFGQSWIHVVCEKPDSPLRSLRNYYYRPMQIRAPVHAQSMKKARFGAASCRVCIMETPLPRSTWILRTSCVMWTSSRTCGVKLEVFRDHRFRNSSSEWTSLDVDVSRLFYVHAQYLIDIDITNREQTILTVTGGVS